MPMKVNASGWKDVRNAYVNVGGTWRPVKGAWAKDGGIWRPLLGGWMAKAENTTDPSIYGHLAVVGGQLYYIGGILSGQSTATTRVSKYDPSTNTWSANGVLGSYRKNDGACVVRGGRYIHIFGGTDNYGVHAMYDTATGSATAKTNLYASQGPVMGVTPAGEIYAAGGFDGSPRNYCRKWVDNGGTGTVVALSNLPAYRAWGLGGVINGKLYHFGGSDSGGNWMTDGYAYDIETNTWANAPSLPEASAHAPHFIKNGKLYYVNNTNHTFIFDPVTNAWTQGPDCGINTYFGKGAASDSYGTAYVHGGFDNGNGALTGRLYALDIP